MDTFEYTPSRQEIGLCGIEASMGRAYSPFTFTHFVSRGVVPGWYETLLRRWSFAMAKGFLQT